MPRSESLFTILEFIGKLPTTKERVDVLRNHVRSAALAVVLKNMFDPSVKFLLPEGVPPYKVNEFDEQQRLLSEIRKLYIFIEGQSPPGLTQLKRERLFIDLLESVDPQDAKLLLMMKDKRCDIPGITDKVAKKAFPDIGA